jgi:hypothetical protein
MMMASCQQLQPLPLLLAVAEANPDVFRNHLLQPMSPATKRALNASCQLASRHVRPAVSSITVSNKVFCTTSSEPSTMPIADPTTRYPAISEL